jgi:hypothetical protein
VILLVPCPLSIVPPIGTIHSNEVALPGSAAIEYVYTLLGHNAIFTTSIFPGVPGFNLDIVKDLAPLVPQPFVAVTDNVPPVKPEGYLKLIVFVPCPLTFVTPAGNVHVYTSTFDAAVTL